MTEHPASAEHFDDCIDCHRAKYATPGMTAEEFAPYLPAHLRQEYWRAKLTEYFTATPVLELPEGWRPDMSCGCETSAVDCGASSDREEAL